MADGASMLLAGKISGAYGIKGWVRIHALTDDIEDILAFPALYLETRGAMQPLEILEGRRHGKGLIARLAGVDSREAAETLRGRDIWIERADLPALEEGDYYWHELEGMQVWCRVDGDYVEEGAEEGAGEGVGEIADEGAGETAGGSTHEGSQLLGVVDHLLETGANDVLVLRPCPGSIDDRERLLPYLPGRVVSKVDRCRGRIDVRWHPDD